MFPLQELEQEAKSVAISLNGRWTDVALLQQMHLKEPL
jgi:hypothetical protein